MPAGLGDRRRRGWARAIAVECPDLLAVGGLALAGVAVVLVPTLAPPRPVVGLAFLLVVPGYATTVALFPVPSARAADRATPTRLERAALTVAGGAVLAGTLAIGATLAGFRLTLAEPSARWPPGRWRRRASALGSGCGRAVIAPGRLSIGSSRPSVGPAGRGSR